MYELRGKEKPQPWNPLLSDQVSKMWPYDDKAAILAKRTVIVEKQCSAAKRKPAREKRLKVHDGIMDLRNPKSFKPFMGSYLKSNSFNIEKLRK